MLILVIRRGSRRRISWIVSRLMGILMLGRINRIMGWLLLRMRVACGHHLLLLLLMGVIRDGISGFRSHVSRVVMDNRNRMNHWSRRVVMMMVAGM
jgi:hypothetical protein